LKHIFFKKILFQFEAGTGEKACVCRSGRTFQMQRIGRIGILIYAQLSSFSYDF
jgi:hypothetical protein